jgi:ABC-type Fe3+/spermidine/putrescine transport system ATPase subunit
MPSVQLVNISKRYGDLASVEDVNLSIEDKEYVCIIGPSGCGKTTLLRCISGIIQPTEGEVYIDGKLMNNIPMQDRGVGYVFQDIALFPHMDVYENVSYGPIVKGWEQSKTKPLIEEMLNMMNLRDRINDHPNVLSGGAQQKTAIARALASGSLLLLLDEPLGSLDAKVRVVLRHELKKMIKDLALTAIHVTHDQEEAMAVSDRIVVMKKGRIVEVGTPLQLYLHPKQLFTANFVGEANFFEGHIEGETDKGVKLQVDGSVLYSSEKLSFRENEAIAVIRPEFVVMEKHRRAELWNGTVEAMTFIGSMIRYEVKTKNGKTVSVKMPYSSFAYRWNTGDQVYLKFLPNSVLLYSYPQSGLEKEISVE